MKEKFAQDWRTYDDGTCYGLISTQVIEAGLNITCEVMPTHLSPMNSLLQQAGCCARFPSEQGEVYVYWSFQVNQVHSKLTERDLNTESEKPSEKKQSFLPYSNEICELTWQVLQIYILPPERLVVNRNGYKLRYWNQQAHKDYRKEHSKEAPPISPMQDGFVFREWVHLEGNLQICCGATSRLADLERLCAQINYFELLQKELLAPFL